MKYPVTEAQLDAAASKADRDYQLAREEEVMLNWQEPPDAPDDRFWIGLVNGVVVCLVAGGIVWMAVEWLW